MALLLQEKSFLGHLREPIFELQVLTFAVLNNIDNEVLLLQIYHLQNNPIGRQEAEQLDNAWKKLQMQAEKSNSSRNVLCEIEQTIEELEIYLEANPDDEIAQVQYQQFLSKREDFNLLMTEAYDSPYDSEIQA